MLAGSNEREEKNKMSGGGMYTAKPRGLLGIQAQPTKIGEPSPTVQHTMNMNLYRRPPPSNFGRPVSIPTVEDRIRQMYGQIGGK